MKRTIFATVVALLGLLVGATPAAGDGDTRCVGVFTGTADNVIVPSGVECILQGAQVRGNVLAKPESMLFIEQSTVHGNVEVKRLAHTGSFQSLIGGNYRCDDCFFEDVVETRVGGNVAITGADDGDFIIESTIGGNVQIENSLAGAFAFIIAGNTIGGDVKFEKNRGPVAIEANRISGELQIFDNNVLGACPPENCGMPLENGHFNDNQVLGGNMQVFRNKGPTEVMRNVIAQNLQCFKNTPPPASAGNAARQYQGQCLA
jgi:hypothetical protein